MSKASKLVSSAIIGSDYKIVVVNGKSYKIFPPTIKKMAGAGQYLSDLKDGETIKDILGSVNDIGKLAHALSWFVDGSEKLTAEFEKASIVSVSAFTYCHKKEGCVKSQILAQPIIN